MKQKDILYLYNSGTADAPAWDSTAKTLTSLPLSLNANTEESQFIEDATSTTTVLNLAPSYAYTARPQEVSPSSLDEFLWKAHVRQAIDAQVELLVVYLKKQDTESGTFEAHRGVYNVQPDSGPGGDAGSNVELTGTLAQYGDLVHGTAAKGEDGWGFTPESQG